MDQCIHEVRTEYWKGVIKACGQRPDRQFSKRAHHPDFLHWEEELDVS